VVHLDLQEQQGHLVPLVHRDQLGQEALMDHREALDLMELRDHLVFPEKMEQME
jgi:hypothetical protein